MLRSYIIYKSVKQFQGHSGSHQFVTVVARMNYISIYVLNEVNIKIIYVRSCITRAFFFLIFELSSLIFFKMLIVHSFGIFFLISECFMVDPVYVGFVQSSVTYALHRVWSFPATKYDRHVAYNFEHAQWCYMLRAFPWTHYNDNSIF